MPLTPPIYDALIVGAGPAGCAAAYDLAHAGRRVLLLDRRTFPRPKACACGLTRKTLKALRYSVAPVLERHCRDVVLQEAGPAFLTGRRHADKACEVRVRLRQPFCAMAVRERFDHFCLQQTLDQGAELRRIDRLLALREHPTHVELTVALPDGTPQTLTAPALIGADGSNGQTRRLANRFHPNAPEPKGHDFSRAETPTEAERLQPLRSAGTTSSEPKFPEPATISGATPTLHEATTANLPPEPTWYQRGFALEATVPYNLLPAQLPAGDHPHDLVFDFAPIAGGYGWLFPKADHINIGVGGFVPQSPAEAPSLCESVTRALLASYTHTKLGVDLNQLPASHVTGQHLGLGGHAYIPQGRILLTGDAAGLVDPLTGEGIHSAIVSGQAAAAALLDPTGNLAAAYARHLQPLQETLAFSHRAARSFYREPERGFRVMRTPLLRRLVLTTYADGLPTTKLLASLARRVA